LRNLSDASVDSEQDAFNRENILSALAKVLYEANVIHAALAICKHLQSQWTYPDDSTIPTGGSPEQYVAVLMLASEVEAKLERIADARKTLGVALALIKSLLSENPDEPTMLQKQEECQRKLRFLMTRS